jgi:hypothetical protein
MLSNYKDVWITYRSDQATQLAQAIRALIEGGMIPEDERSMAESLERRLRNIRGPGYTMILLSEPEYEFMNALEYSLWT